MFFLIIFIGGMSGRFCRGWVCCDLLVVWTFQGGEGHFSLRRTQRKSSVALLYCLGVVSVFFPVCFIVIFNIIAGTVVC